jgi:aldehyde dehydrogenase (NAD+)
MPYFTHIFPLPQQIHASLRAGFKSGKLTSIAYRKYQLIQLVYFLKDNMSRFEEALKKDMGRPVLESRL